MNGTDVKIENDVIFENCRTNDKNDNDATDATLKMITTINWKATDADVINVNDVTDATLKLITTLKIIQDDVKF